MPLPRLEELVERARRELDAEFARLRSEIEQRAEEVKRRRLEEIEKAVERFVGEVRRMGGGK